jgi:hypothetical protein
MAGMFFKQKYGTGLDAAVAMSLDLMAGDAATFKAGYSAENAAIATAKVFSVDKADVLAGIKEELAETAKAVKDFGDYATESGALDQASGTVYSDADGGL